MKGWFSGRTLIGSLVLGTAIGLLLFEISGTEFTLSGLDLFFAITTVVSLGFNLWQLFRDHYKYQPLKNGLIGLFNDLKGRQLRAFQRQQLLTSQASANLPRDALQLEFFDFVQETTQSLEQLREHVVAAIHALDPNASAQQAFRAAEFGLNDQEKQFRREQMDRFMAQSRTTSGQPVASGDAG